MIGTSRSNTRSTPSPMEVSIRRMSRTRRVKPAGLQRRRLVRTPHRPIEGDMPFHDAGPQRHGGGGGNARLVPRVSYRNAELLLEHGDDPQVQFLIVGRIGAAGVQEDQVVLADQAHGVVDLIEIAHARRDDYRPALGTDVLQEAVIRQVGSSDLVEGNVKLLDEIDGGFVPPGNPPRGSVFPGSRR